MTRQQEIAEVQRILAGLQQCRGSTATLVLDSSPAKQSMLERLDTLISRARAHLARLGHPDAVAPPMAAAPEAVQ